MGKRLRRAIVPAIVAAALAGYLAWDLASLGQVECSVCVVFEGRRKCATARGPGREVAVEEAQRSACSLMTAGVREAFACPQVSPETVSCR